MLKPSMTKAVLYGPERKTDRASTFVDRRFVMKAYQHSVIDRRQTAGGSVPPAPAKPKTPSSPAKKETPKEKQKPD